MFKLLICISAMLSIVYGNGEFTVLNRPSSIVFKGHDRIKESLLTEVYTASLGYSPEQDSNWQGLYLVDPFNLARAVVTVAVDGVSSLNLEKGHRFPLRTDEDEIDVYVALERRIEERNSEASNNNLVRIDLSDGLAALEDYEIFTGIKDISAKKTKHNFLKTSVEEDRDFLQELALLDAIADKIKNGFVKEGAVPDVFWFKVSTLHALSDLYGENSTQTKEAKHLLAGVIGKVNDAFAAAYDGRALVSVISSDASHTRRTRSVDASAQRAEDDFSDLNLAKVYSNDYPVIFNILLWFGVAMVFSLLAISIFIGSMDPGRDSIIYRMTSTRMKKDN